MRNASGGRVHLGALGFGMSFLAIALGFGCNDSDGSDGANGRALGQLTDGEVLDLCHELRPYMLSTATRSCTAGAIDFAESAGRACAEERQSCIEDSVPECSVDTLRPDDECNDVSVADFRSCIMFLASESEKVYGKDVDCETGLDPQSTAPPKLSEACQRMMASCPRLTPGAGEPSDDGGDSSEPSTCHPKAPVGGCADETACFVVTNPGLTEERITSSLCQPGQTYVDSCETTGAQGRCATLCGPSNDVVYYFYEGDLAAQKAKCDFNDGEWLPL